MVRSGALLGDLKSTFSVDTQDAKPALLEPSRLLGAPGPDKCAVHDAVMGFKCCEIQCAWI